MVLPESAGDVLPRVIVRVLVEPLVGRGLVERTEVLEVRTDLDVVEVVLVHFQRHAHLATVPRHFQFGVLLVDVLCQTVDATRFGITTHEGDAGDVLAVLLDEVIDGIGGERKTDVLPQILRVTAWAVTGTSRYVDGKCHLIGNLLEHDAAVDIFEHGKMSFFATAN